MLHTAHLSFLLVQYIFAELLVKMGLVLSLELLFRFPTAATGFGVNARVRVRVRIGVRVGVRVRIGVRVRVDVRAI